MTSKTYSIPENGRSALLQRRKSFQDCDETKHKKIVQLTKVIQHLNTQVEEHNQELIHLKQTHETEIDQIISETYEKINQAKKIAQLWENKAVSNELFVNFKEQYRLEKEKTCAEMEALKKEWQQQSQNMRNEYNKEVQQLKAKAECLYQQTTLRINQLEVEMSDSKRKHELEIEDLAKNYQNELKNALSQVQQNLLLPLFFLQYKEDGQRILTTMQSIIEEKAQLISKHEKELKELNEKHKKQVQSDSEIISVLKCKIKTVEDKIEEQKAQNKSLNDKIGQYNSQAELWRQQNAELKTSLATCKDEIKNKNSAYQLVMNELTTTKETCDRHKAKNAELTCLLNELKNKQSHQNTEFDSKSAALKSSIEALTVNDFIYLFFLLFFFLLRQSEFSTLLDEKKKLEIRFQAMQTEHTTKMTLLESTMSSQQRKLKELQQLYDNLKEDNNSLTNSRELIAKELKEQKKRCHALSSELSNEKKAWKIAFQNFDEEFKICKAKIEQKINSFKATQLERIGSLTQKYEKEILQLQSDELKKKAQHALEESQLEAQLLSHKEHIKTLESQLSQSSTDSELSKQSYQDELHKAALLKATLDDQIKTYMEEITHNKVEITQLKTNLSLLDQTCSDTSRRLKDSENRLLACQTEAKALQVQNGAEQNSFQKMIAQLKDQIQQKENQLTQYASEHENNITMQKNKHEQEMQKLKDQFAAALEQSQKKLKDEMNEMTKQSEKQIAQDKKKYGDDLGITTRKYEQEIGKIKQANEQHVNMLKTIFNSDLEKERLRIKTETENELKKQKQALTQIHEKEKLILSQEKQILREEMNHKLEALENAHKVAVQNYETIKEQLSDQLAALKKELTEQNETNEAEKGQLLALFGQERAQNEQQKKILVEDFEKEKQQITTKFKQDVEDLTKKKNEDVNVLQFKLKQLQNQFCCSQKNKCDSWKEKYDNRSSLPEDVQQIEELKMQTFSLQKMLTEKEKVLEQFRRDMLNREESYNKVFGRSPKIGVLSTLPNQNISNPNSSARKTISKDKSKKNITNFV
ncbi:hypothetical protein RFI_35479 [Reticulomyxa filosa]|uniref:Uncharacterized protein n=1 Tax=Reticulomyxa filosa TaxID=46433 RepID=X6LJ49_RETFI|nr:hypothetical protein RFI_35479 [Reticulomyxa filosa]|eukprot:ETO01958.1 hypothetical protein RFI_35479 [Reticulomyxa filosa]